MFVGVAAMDKPPEQMSARELVNEAFHMLLRNTAKTAGPIQNDIIGAMGLLETAESRIRELEQQAGLAETTWKPKP